MLKPVFKSVLKYKIIQNILEIKTRSKNKNIFFCFMKVTATKIKETKLEQTKSLSKSDTLTSVIQDNSNISAIILLKSIKFL